MPTDRFALAADAWTDLGPTPCTVQLDQVYPVRLSIGTVMPQALDAPAHTMLSGEDTSWCDIGLEGQRAFARAIRESGAAVVVSR